MTEQQLHRQVTNFLDISLTSGSWWSTFPAGGGARSWQNLQGLKRGVPDILIIARELRPLWIELKTDRGQLSPQQIVTHATLKNAGCIVETCRSVDEVHKLLGYLGILRDGVELA